MDRLDELFKSQCGPQGAHAGSNRSKATNSNFRSTLFSRQNLRTSFSTHDPTANSDVYSRFAERPIQLVSADLTKLQGSQASGDRATFSKFIRFPVVTASRPNSFSEDKTLYDANYDGSQKDETSVTISNQYRFGPSKALFPTTPRQDTYQRRKVFFAIVIILVSVWALGLGMFFTLRARAASDAAALDANRNEMSEGTSSLPSVIATASSRSFVIA